MDRKRRTRDGGETRREMEGETRRERISKMIQRDCKERNREEIRHKK